MRKHLTYANVMATLAVANADLANGAVNGASVFDGSLTSDDLGSGSVGSSEIATDAVGAPEIADGSIDGGEIIDESMSSDDLAADSVQNSELADDAVGTANVAGNSLTTADIEGTDVNGSISLAAGESPQRALRAVQLVQRRRRRGPGRDLCDPGRAPAGGHDLCAARPERRQRDPQRLQLQRHDTGGDHQPAGAGDHLRLSRDEQQARNEGAG